MLESKDMPFNFAWDLNEVLCEVIEGGADESRTISAKVAAHPRMKKWLSPEPVAWRWQVYGIWHYAGGFPVSGAEPLYTAPVSNGER